MKLQATFELAESWISVITGLPWKHTWHIITELFVYEIFCIALRLKSFIIWPCNVKACSKLNLTVSFVRILHFFKHFEDLHITVICFLFFWLSSKDSWHMSFIFRRITAIQKNLVCISFFCHQAFSFMYVHNLCVIILPWSRLLCFRLGRKLYFICLRKCYDCIVSEVSLHGNLTHIFLFEHIGVFCLHE